MKNSTTMLLCSDIMQHDLQHESGKEFGYADIFSDEFVQIASSCDVVVANLETPITLSTTNCFPRFNSNPEFLQGINSQLQFTALSIANNHSLDQGQHGLLSTSIECRKNGIVPFGAVGNDFADVVLHTTNQKIVFHAFTDISNVENGSDMLNMQFGSRQIQDDEIGILYVHTGVEYSSKMTRMQKLYSRKAKEYGYTACIMIHSHVIGECNHMTSDSMIVVSNGLGNLLSFQNTLTKQYGASIKIEVDNVTKKIVDFKLIKTETVLIDNRQQVVIL